jgi:hypothetical protein
MGGVRISISKPDWTRGAGQRSPVKIRHREGQGASRCGRPLPATQLVGGGGDQGVATRQRRFASACRSRGKAELLIRELDSDVAGLSGVRAGGGGRPISSGSELRQGRGQLRAGVASKAPRRLVSLNSIGRRPRSRNPTIFRLLDSLIHTHTHIRGRAGDPLHQFCASHSLLTSATDPSFDFPHQLRHLPRASFFRSRMSGRSRMPWNPGYSGREVEGLSGMRARAHCGTLPPPSPCNRRPRKLTPPRKGRRARG